MSRYGPARLLLTVAFAGLIALTHGPEGATFYLALCIFVEVFWQGYERHKAPPP